MYVFSLQLCLILCDPMDCSLVGSSAHGIVQARILEWVAMSFSRGSSQPRDRTCVSCVSCIGGWVLYHCTTTVEPPHNCLAIIELDEWTNYELLYYFLKNHEQMVDIYLFIFFPWIAYCFLRLHFFVMYAFSNKIFLPHFLLPHPLPSTIFLIETLCSIMATNWQN